MTFIYNPRYALRIAFIFEQVAAFAFQRDATIFQNVRAVCDLQTLVNVLLDEQDRDAFLTDLFDDVKKFIHEQGRETDGWLVETRRALGEP